MCRNISVDRIWAVGVLHCTKVCHEVVTSRLVLTTSSTAQGGGGSFKNRKRIGEIDCCE